MSFIKEEYDFYYQRPAKVQIDVTNRCNFNCIYCYNKNNDFLQNKELTDDELLQLAERVINELDPVVVSLSGGEALLRKNILLKLIKKFSDAEIDTWLTSNISLMDEATIYELKEAGLKKLFTNLDSETPEVHDYLRGHNRSYEKSLATIKQLVDILGGDKVITTIVLTNQNYKSVNAIADLSIKLGAHKMHMLDLIPISQDNQKLMLNKEQWLELKKDVENYPQADKIELQLCHSFVFMSDSYKKMNFPFCMAGRFTMVITADGSVVPCNHLKFKHFYAGDAKTENLLELWQNSPVLKQFRYYDFSDTTCKSCNRFKQCNGGCKAMSYALLKNAFLQDPYCKEFSIHD